MDSWSEYLMAKKAYEHQRDFVNDTNSNVKPRDFYELARLRKISEEKYADFYLSQESREDNSSSDF